MKDVTLEQTISFSNRKGHTPSLQMFAFTSAGSVVGYSDYRMHEGSVLGGSIEWSSKSGNDTVIRYHLGLIPVEVTYIACLARVPLEKSLGEFKTYTRSTLTLSRDKVQLCVDTGQVPLWGDGDSVDWFVYNVLVIDHSPPRVLVKDVLSFPSNRTNVIPQLKDLIDSVRHELSSGRPLSLSDGWADLLTHHTEVANPVIPSDPGEFSYFPLQKSPKQSLPPPSPMSPHATDLSAEIDRLRLRCMQLEDDVAKRDMMISKLRAEIRGVSSIDTSTGIDESMSLMETLDTEWASKEDIDSQLQTQEVLITSIKDRLLRLNGLIRNGQRMRHI